MKTLTVLSVLPCLLFGFIRFSVGQGDRERCDHAIGQNGVPQSCSQYYSQDDGFFNATHRRGMLPRTIDDISIELITRNGPCVDLVLHYLCYYYYPICNQTTGVVTQSCTSSCNLLVNSQMCLDFLREASRIIEVINVPVPDADCQMTFDTADQPNEMSENCIAIEETFDGMISLDCPSVPSSNRARCFPPLTGTHFAPRGSKLVDDSDALQIEISMIANQSESINQCVDMIEVLECLVALPVCDDTTGMIVPVCPTLCTTIDSMIAECRELFVNNTSNFPLVNQLLTINCSNPTTYYKFPSWIIGNGSSDQCIGDDNSNSPAFIAGIVAGVIVAIIIIVIIIVVLAVIRKRKHIPRFFRESYEIPSPEPTARYNVHRPNKNQDQLTLDLNYPSNSNSPYAPRHGRLNTEEASVRTSRSSLLEINQLLQYVIEKFSEILLPAEVVTRLEFIGKGAFGVVHKGELVTSDGVIKAVAIKTIKSTNIDGMKDLVAETAIMKGFHHPNVLPLLGVCVDYDDNDMIKIVIPFMAHGDLRTFLKESRVSPNNTHEYPKGIFKEVLKRMCLDIASGMEYLAEKRFVHRDLAARNCMVDESLRIRVADFGLTRDIYSTEYYRIEQHATLPVKWMALESLLDGYFDEKTDVWSYGVTCWEIFSLGRIPYPGVDNAEVIKTLKTGERLDKPDLCPSDMYEMLESTWNAEPDKRPSFSDIVHTLSDGVEDTGVTSDDSTVEHATESNGYIDIQELQT